MSSATLRPLASADLHDASRLLATLNPETPPGTVHQRLVTLIQDHPHYELHGAFVADRLVGLAGAWIATKIWCGRYLEIDNLVVDPDHRSGGIGGALITHLEGIAKERGCNVITLDSYSGNHPSHRLYHRLGFEIWSFHFIKPIGNWMGKEGA